MKFNMKFGRIVSALASLVLWLPGSASQGIDTSIHTQLYPSKESFLAGEPVFVVLELENSGTEPVMIDAVTGRGVCALVSGLQIEINGTKPKIFVRDGCQGGYAGSCLGGSVVLEPGETHQHQYLLNDWFDLGKAGVYRVHIQQELGWRQPSEYQPKPLRRLEERFDISVVPATEAALRRAYEPILRQMSSSEPHRRYEAMYVLATMAPPFLEDTIVGLGYSSDSSEQAAAINALERLNTARSRTELARLAQEANESVQQQAIFALGRIGNLAHLPLLRELAGSKNRYIQHAAIRSAGRVGRQDAVAFLLPLLRSEDPAVRHDAVFGLAFTGNREAVGAIIEMLLDPDSMVRQSAANALPSITHRRVPGDMEHRGTAEEAARRWSRWWALNWDKAEVYGPNNCGTIQPLE